MRGVIALPVEDTKEESALDVNDKRDKKIGRYASHGHNFLGQVVSPGTRKSCSI